MGKKLAVYWNTMRSSGFIMNEVRHGSSFKSGCGRPG